MATPVRNVRVSDGLWAAAQSAAEHQGTTVSAVVVSSLERYVRRHGTEMDRRRQKIAALVAGLPPMSDAELLELLRGTST